MPNAAAADLAVAVLYLRLFFLRLRILRVTFDQEDLLHVREERLDVLGGVHDSDGAALAAAVAGLGGLMLDLDGGPVEGVELGVELRCVDLDGHDVVGEQFLAPAR